VKGCGRKTEHFLELFLYINHRLKRSALQNAVDFVIPFYCLLILKPIILQALGVLNGGF